MDRFRLHDFVVSRHESSHAPFSPHSEGEESSEAQINVQLLDLSNYCQACP